MIGPYVALAGLPQVPAWLLVVGSILGGGFGSLALKLLGKRLDKRDTQTTQITVVSERETTARFNTATGERVAQHEREDRVLERLHDECRKEVSELRSEVRDARTESAANREALARCEERHAAFEERVERLERGSSRPPSMEPAE